MIFLRLAWRNVWRNMRRTLITLSAISFGLAAMLVFFAVTDGFHSQWVENTVRLSSGHIVIHLQGYHRRPDIKKAFSPAPVMEALKGLDEVEGVSPRVGLQGLASTAENSSGVWIIGLDPEDNSGITDLRKALIYGDYLLDKRGALVGRKLAKRLRLAVGDKAVLMGQTFDATLGSELFRVSGIFESGSMEFDSSVVIVGIEDARRLTGLKEMITAVSVLADNTSKADALKKKLIAREELRGYEMLDWKQQSPMLKQVIDADDVFLYIILLIIVIVVAFGIVNTIHMSVAERTKELGVMVSMGTKPWQIVLMIVFESSIVGLMGTGLGVILGFLANMYYGIEGIDLSAWADAIKLFAAVEPVMYPEVTVRGVAFSSLLVLATTVLASIYPAVKAARLSPVEAIRYA
jgi:ABC-type lipoprotein release transport system permease subunit